MPYITTRRLHGIAGRKISKHLTYRRAKMLCSEVNRGIAFLESRFLRSRLNQA